MNISGKVRPEVDQLNQWYADGFERVELFLTTEMLESRGVAEIVDECEQADPAIGSVHTPHVPIDEANVSEYIAAADTIADVLDATLVVDVNPTSTRYTPTLFPPSQLDAPRVGYENDPGVSAYYLGVNHLEQGYPLTLDTAHLHMSSDSYLPFIEDIAANCSADQLPVVHLADGTRTQDGLPFGEGTIDLERIVRVLDTHDYAGTVVLETPVAKQAQALELVRDWLAD